MGLLWAGHGWPWARVVQGNSRSATSRVFGGLDSRGPYQIAQATICMSAHPLRSSLTRTISIFSMDGIWIVSAIGTLSRILQLQLMKMAKSRRLIKSLVYLLLYTYIQSSGFLHDSQLICTHSATSLHLEIKLHSICRRTFSSVFSCLPFGAISAKYIFFIS